MQRSNILFIVADDLNSWIGPLGAHPDVRTPGIDAMARQGSVFTRAYCAAPYCNASRMAVFTGCLPGTTGIYQNEPFWENPLRHRTFLEHLREAGYYCHGAGKVFHGTFDYASAGRHRTPNAVWRDSENRIEMWDSFSPNIAEPMPPARPLNGMFDFDDFGKISPWNHLFDWGPLPDDREVDMPDAHAAADIEAFLQAPSDEPFFCAAGLYKPHLPWYVPKRYFDLYPLDQISLPFVKADDLDDVPDIPRDWVRSRPDHETVLRHGQWRHAVQGYLAAISYCDSVIARLMDALARSPAAENTWVVLWGDNGFHLGEKLHWRKFVLWEEATRVPLIIVPPPGTSLAPRIDAPVSLVDIFPTLCDLIGLDSLPGIDGVSLTPLMRGQLSTRGAPALMTWKEGNHSLRDGQWRYTRYHDGTEELYDQHSDPREWTNLAGDARFIGVLRNMRSCLAPCSEARPSA